MTHPREQVIDQSLPSPESLAASAEQVLAAAAAGGATGAVAAISISVGLSVTVRSGEVESIEFQRDHDLSLTVYRGQRTGSASSADWSQASLDEVVARALSISKLTGEDPAAGLPDAARLATEFPDLDLYHPWSLSVADAIEIAKACEAAALAADPRIDQSEGATVDTQAGLTLLANSLGFVGHRQGTSHSISASVIARDGDDMQRDYWYDTARRADALAAAEAIGQRAGERTAARLGAAPIATAAMPVLFVPEMARGLIGHFLGAISGSSLYRKASFLLDADGKQVFAPNMAIHQQPLLPGAAGSRSFDGEGVAVSDRTLIDPAGVLHGYLLDSYSARRLGLETTGNAGGPANVIVTPGVADFDALLADMGEGLVVTELMGQGVDRVTGDYSRGAAGFMVRGGQLAEPVDEVTVAGNLSDIYRRIRAVGSDVDTRGNVRTGSLLIDGLTIAGR